MNNKSIILGNKRAELAIAISSQIRQQKKTDDQQLLSQIIESPKNENQQLIKNNLNQSWVHMMYKREQKLVPLSGYLQKKSPYSIVGYQKKYCKLQDRIFSYYHSENLQELEGYLDFDLQGYEFREVQNNKNQIIEFTLIPKGTKKEFIFKAEKPEATHLWALQIKIQMNDSFGNQQQLCFLAQIPKFWKNTSIKNAKVQNECQDGDIVLFKSKSTFTKAARAILMCEYDHVSLLYRDEGVLYCFEAVQSGVGIFPWTHLIEQDWLKDYEKICIRKLKYHKKQTPEVQDKLKQFITNNLGNSYSLDPTKFFKTVSQINTVKPNQIEEKKRTFFCSELVAKAYKEIGLLNPIKSSTQYYPKDFTSEKNLQLLDGATLDPELLVIFEV